MYEIEDSIPLPGRRRKTKYPYDTLEVGQSFFVECNKEQVGKNITNLSNCARLWAKRHHKNWKYCVRKVEGGVRVWRTK